MSKSLNVFLAIYESEEEGREEISKSEEEGEISKNERGEEEEGRKRYLSFSYQTSHLLTQLINSNSQDFLTTQLSEVVMFPRVV